MLIKLSFLPHGLKNTVSSFIAQHGKASLHHGRKTMLLGIFLFGVAKKGSIRANSQTTRKPEGSFSLVLARCNYARSISPLSVNTLKGSYQVSVFRAGKCKACTGCARSHLPRFFWGPCYEPQKKVECPTERCLLIISWVRAII